jgi:hypothetical protein
MRGLFILLCVAVPLSVASAETPSGKQPADNRHSQQSTGKTDVPDKGQIQPQGPTGPITTGTSGGAPASSPQGETPPGMQSAPEGSSKTISGPK